MKALKTSIPGHPNCPACHTKGLVISTRISHGVKVCTRKCPSCDRKWDDRKIIPLAVTYPLRNGKHTRFADVILVQVVALHRRESLSPVRIAAKVGISPKSANNIVDWYNFHVDKDKFCEDFATAVGRAVVQQRHPQFYA